MALRTQLDLFTGAILVSGKLTVQTSWVSPDLSQHSREPDLVVSVQPELREVIKKNCEKAVRLTALREGGITPPSPSLTASICENFRTFSPLNMIP